MSMIVIWEWIINLFALGGALLIFAFGFSVTRGGDSPYRSVGLGAVLAWTPIYLLTMLLFGFLTGGSLNYSGDDGIFDPWNSFFGWTPIMKWWMWPIVIAAVVCYFVSRMDPNGSSPDDPPSKASSSKASIQKFSTMLARILGIILIVIGVLGMQWNNPFARSVEAGPRDCPVIFADFDPVWNEYNAIIDRQRDSPGGTDAAVDDEIRVNQLGIRKDELHQELASSSCGVEDVEVRLLSPPTVNERTITVTATRNSGKYLKQYEWLTGDPNNGSYLFSDEPVLRYTYSPGTPPGTYKIILKASDVFGHQSLDSIDVVLN